MRRQRLLGAAIVVAVTALTTGVGTAARAAPLPPSDTDPVISVSVPADLRLPIGQPARTVTLRSSTANVTAPKVVFDLAGLGDVAEFEFPAGCTSTASITTCPLPASGDHPFQLVAVPPKEGTVGDTGTVHVSVVADGVAAKSAGDLKVTLAEGVDITLADFPNGGNVKPLDKVRVPGSLITNVGDKTVVGMTVIYRHNDPTLVPTQYANCTYTAAETTCEIDTELAPTHQVDVPALEYTLTADALGPKKITVTVTALKESDELPADTAAAAQRATANELAPTAPAAGAEPDANADANADPGTAADTAPLREPNELNPADNVAEFAFTVTNTYDIEALGATATGAVGTTVKVVIGARNNGPGTLDSGSDEKVWRYFFVVPPGTETTVVPDRCAGKVVTGNSFEYVAGKLGVTLYRCTHEGTRFPASTTSTVEFSLKITQVIADAAGNVSWTDPDATQQVPADTNTANDKAAVVINASTATGSLPITGANVTVLAGVGLGLVVAGGGLFLVSRRRRPEETE